MEQKVFEAKGLGPDGKDWLVPCCDHLLRPSCRTTFFRCIACQSSAGVGFYGSESASQQSLKSTAQDVPIKDMCLLAKPDEELKGLGRASRRTGMFEVPAI